MNLQSKFGCCLVTLTLNIALCKRPELRTDKQTDGQAGKRTDNPITRCPSGPFRPEAKTDNAFLPGSYMSCKSAHRENMTCVFLLTFTGFSFLVHLSRRLKCTIVIMRCPSSVCRPSSVVVNFSYFRLLL